MVYYIILACTYHCLSLTMQVTFFQELEVKNVNENDKQIYLNYMYKLATNTGMS